MRSGVTLMSSFAVAQVLHTRAVFFRMSFTVVVFTQQHHNASTGFTCDALLREVGERPRSAWPPHSSS